MKTFLVIILLPAALFFSCARSPRMLDYISLPPPERVQVRTLTDGGLEVSWKLPPDYLRARIKEYVVFIAGRSLIYDPIDRLPEPVRVVSKNENRCRIDNLPAEKELFIHVRSRNALGDMSLPSLPEVHVKNPQKE